MPGWLKVVIGVFLVLTILGGVGAFFAVRWLRGEAASMKEAAEAMDREARAFAQGKNAEACVAESLARVDRCGGGVLCQVKTRVFLSRCLAAVEVPADFCADVPTGITAAAKWQADECARRGRPNDQACMQVMMGLVEYCRPK
jgi:hypothetical protein